MCYYGSLLVAPPDRADDSICPLPHHHTLSALLLANRIKALIFILKSKYCKDMSDEGYKMGIKIANVPQKNSMYKNNICALDRKVVGRRDISTPKNA
jgi:hypothetical protein